MFGHEPSYEELSLVDPLGWVEAKPFPDRVNNNSFISGRRDSRAIRVHYYEKKSERILAGRSWFGPEAEGPPGYAHGGSQAALLDEGMGAAAWLSGKTVVAAKIEINFRQPLPLGTTLTMWAEVTKIDGKKIYASGQLKADDGTVYSEGTGLFIVIDPAELLRRRSAQK